MLRSRRPQDSDTPILTGVPLPENDPPSPLVVACSLTALEAALLLMYAGAEMFNLDSGRVTMGLTTSAFFAVYGLGLLLCAWSVYRLNSWARAPIVAAQLVQLGVAFSFWGGGTTVVAICLGLVALGVLAGILHPDSVKALADEG